jgi:enterochelin esterase-like enzyme
MRKKLLIMVLSLMLSITMLWSNAFAASDKKSQTESTIVETAFFSKSLQKQMDVNVYLPPGYSNQKKYPVLYVLHQLNVDEKFWFDEVLVGKQADLLIESGEIQPLIIVSPQIDHSWGLNSADEVGMIDNYWNIGRYEDYITKDLIEFIDSNFSTKKSRSGRYIGGTSMGGYAALLSAFKHHELYSKVGGHAPALFETLWEPLNQMAGDTDEERQHNNPIWLAMHENLNMLDIYLDVGDEDYLKAGALRLNEIMQDQNLKNYQFHYNPGGKHDVAYWSSQAKNYLLFYVGNKK